jgi:hypothetical protein
VLRLIPPRGTQSRSKNLTSRVKWPQVDINQSNQFARATILVGRTVRRLLGEGCPAEEAKRLVAQVIDSEEIEMPRQRRPFDEAGMTERLKRLPAL